MVWDYSLGPKFIMRLYVFGDSLLIIDWMKYHIPPRNVYLRPISEELIIIVFKFWEISFQPVSRERNPIADHLSKDGILLGDGEWKNGNAKITPSWRMIRVPSLSKLCSPNC